MIDSAWCSNSTSSKTMSYKSSTKVLTNTNLSANDFKCNQEQIHGLISMDQWNGRPKMPPLPKQNVNVSFSCPESFLSKQRDAYAKQRGSNRGLYWLWPNFTKKYSKKHSGKVLCNATFTDKVGQNCVHIYTTSVKGFFCHPLETTSGWLSIECVSTKTLWVPCFRLGCGWIAFTTKCTQQTFFSISKPYFLQKDRLDGFHQGLHWQSSSLKSKAFFLLCNLPYLSTARNRRYQKMPKAASYTKFKPKFYP